MYKIFFNLYKDLHSSSFINTNPLKSFLFNTKQHVLILFYIASQPEKKSTLEEICYNISGKIISRSTIQNILKEGVLINFLKKEINEKDKREKYYKITEPATKVLENWAIEQNIVFSAVNNIKIK